MNHSNVGEDLNNVNHQSGSSLGGQSIVGRLGSDTGCNRL